MTYEGGDTKKVVNTAPLRCWYIPILCKKSNMVTTRTIQQERLASRQRAAAKYKKELRKNATKWEKRAFSKLKLTYPSTIFQKEFIRDGKMYIVDFYIPSPYGVIIEIDGAHHYKKDQRAKDKERDNYLKSQGFIVIRVSNDSVDYLDFQTLVETAKKRRNDKTQS